jgi:hypothetical protein
VGRLVGHIQPGIHFNHGPSSFVKQRVDAEPTS